MGGGGEGGEGDDDVACDFVFDFGLFALHAALQLAVIYYELLY